MCAPGIDGHSRVKPKLPLTIWTEPVNEAGYMDAEAVAAAAAAAADPYSVGADAQNAAPAPVPMQAPAPVPVMPPLGQAPAPVAKPAPMAEPLTGPTVVRSDGNPTGCLKAAEGECGSLFNTPC